MSRNNTKNSSSLQPPKAPEDDPKMDALCTSLRGWGNEGRMTKEELEKQKATQEKAQGATGGQSGTNPDIKFN